MTWLHAPADGALNGVGAPDVGVISGHLLRLLRRTVGFSQTDLAEHLHVDVSTIQSWESGRRSLTALKAANLIHLRDQLTLLGAPAQAAALLIDATVADDLLATAVSAGSAPIPDNRHPLGASVHRRTLVYLLAWPFTGITPQPMRTLHMTGSRGPVPSCPQLSPHIQHRIFDHLLVTADAATDTLLRRQATFLLGFDSRSTSTDWLIGEHRRTMATSPRRDLHIPMLMLTRSAALAMTRHDDLDPVRWYIQHTQNADHAIQANLIYWAYWLGEIPETYASDTAMISSAANSWSGLRVLHHLVGHLNDPRHADINVHSLSTLVQTRPGLADHATPETLSRLRAALDNNVLGQQARQQLSHLLYTLTRP